MLVVPKKDFSEISEANASTLQENENIFRCTISS